jgi:hypothetical protein
MFRNENQAVTSPLLSISDAHLGCNCTSAGHSVVLDMLTDGTFNLNTLQPTAARTRINIINNNNNNTLSSSSYLFHHV